MWKDKIVEEIHKYRDDYAKKFNYDLHAICDDLRKKQSSLKNHSVTLHPKPVSYIRKVA